MNDYWKKQAADKPLFSDILWSRPESKHGAGKLTIIGGSSHGFGAPGIAYNAALKSGVGVCHVVMPISVKKIVHSILPDAEFAPSNASGSFSHDALSTLLNMAQWGDACLLAGDFGRNSETAVALESLTQKFSGLLTITQDAVDYFKETPGMIVDRPKTLIALSLAQLQKLFINTPTITAITFSMSTPQLADALHEYTSQHPACLITQHNDLLFVAHNGQVTTTKHTNKVWRVETAARSSVFWLQNPDKLLEASTTALIAE